MTPKELAERLEARPDLFDRLNSGDSTALIELIEVGTGAKVAKAGVRIVSNPFQELAEEFRRLAAEAKERGLQAEGNYQLQRGKRIAFEQAAQMLEERLNG